MNTRFIYWMPVHICYEIGMIEKISYYISGERVLIISDPFLYQNGVAQKIGSVLKGKKITYFSDVKPNPSFECVDLVAQMARDESVTCVIGLGGGSALDISKIVACLVNNDGSIDDYYKDRSFVTRKAQLIVIPTTSGTGSEVTNVGVFTDHVRGLKRPMVNDQFWADYAILDPELTYSLPPFVTATTGMDAFCHAIEAYWNIDSQPISDILGTEALVLIMKNIKKAYDDPNNIEARGNMMLASMIAGIAFSQTRTTGIHAVSFPLTSEYGACHGVACSITLPAFIEVASEKAKDKMEVLSARLGAESIKDLSHKVYDLMMSMHMPVRLSELGVKADDIPHIAQVALSANIIQLTPATMNQETVETLLNSIL